MATDMKEGPVRGGKDDHASKGYPVIPPNDGDLWKGREVREEVGGFTFLEGMARGDKKSDGWKDAGNRVGFDAGNVWLEGRSVETDAVNRVGGFGDETKSDPMFDKFKHEAKGWEDQVDASGSQSGEKVSSSSLPEGGAKSDPMYKELPDEQSKGPGAKSSQADKD